MTLDLVGLSKTLLTRQARMEDLREIRARLLRVHTTLIVPLLALLTACAGCRAVDLCVRLGGAVEPGRVLAVAGIWTILLGGVDAPLTAVGGSARARS